MLEEEGGEDKGFALLVFGGTEKRSLLIAL